MPASRSRSLTCGLWMISPVRKTLLIGKPLARLIRVVDRAIDAVAETELAREVDGQPAGRVLEVVGADVVDDAAVVCGGQLARDGLLHVEALAEDQRL